MSDHPVHFLEIIKFVFIPFLTDKELVVYDSVVVIGPVVWHLNETVVDFMFRVFEYSFQVFHVIISLFFSLDGLDFGVLGYFGYPTNYLQLLLLYYVNSY